MDKATLNEELGYSELFNPLVSRLASSTLGSKTPPAHAETALAVPSITLPATDGSSNSSFVGLSSGMTSPVTQQDDCLLDNLAPGLPMDVGSSDAGLSRAPGSRIGSCRETPMSQGSLVFPSVG